MYTTYVRLIVEYNSTLWNPLFKRDIHLNESVQHSFACRIPGLSNLQYRERLALLKLDYLELRRLHTDLILIYKMLNDMVACEFNCFFVLIHLYMVCVVAVSELMSLNI